MAVAYSSEIRAAISLGYPEKLSNDVNESNKMISNLNNFKNNGKLRGNMWNRTYQKVDVLNGALTARNNTANDVSSAIQSSLNNVLNSMQGYEMLDTADIPEIEALIKDLYEELNSVEGENEQMVAMMKAAIMARIQQLEAFLKVLENFAVVYDEAVNTLNDALNKVLELNSKVSAITPSPQYSYVK